MSIPTARRIVDAVAVQYAGKVLDAKGVMCLRAAVNEMHRKKAERIGRSRKPRSRI